MNIQLAVVLSGYWVDLGSPRAPSPFPVLLTHVGAMRPDVGGVAGDTCRVDHYLRIMAVIGQPHGHQTCDFGTNSVLSTCSHQSTCPCHIPRYINCPHSHHSQYAYKLLSVH